MVIQLRIEKDGEIETELCGDDVDGRWLRIVVEEGLPEDFRTSELILTVWERAAPKTFMRLAEAFNIDLTIPEPLADVS